MNFWKNMMQQQVRLKQNGKKEEATGENSKRKAGNRNGEMKADSGNREEKKND